MKIIIFGPQGSGKGTQAELIARRHGWPYISTGDIFRYHLKNRTPLGLKVDSFVSSGQLVPDELTNEILQERINQPDCAVGFVLDGYPRNLAQLNFLQQMAKIDFAIVIDLSDAAAIKRLADRLACKCGLSFHPVNNPPQLEGVCDKCGHVLFRRDDDHPEAISRRLAIYHQETEPLFAVFGSAGVLHHVDGEKPIEDVFRQIDDIIHRHTQ